MPRAAGSSSAFFGHKLVICDPVITLNLNHGMVCSLVIAPPGMGWDDTRINPGLVRKIKLMVDRAWSEWDKARMSKQMQQPDTALQATHRKVGVTVIEVLLNAKSALLLGLALIIIPTLNGVALIA